MHFTVEVSEHGLLLQPPAACTGEGPRPQGSSRAQCCLNVLRPRFSKGTVVRGHPIVCSRPIYQYLKSCSKGSPVIMPSFCSMTVSACIKGTVEDSGNTTNLALDEESHAFCKPEHP